jgi:hypothetical protein
MAESGGAMITVNWQTAPSHDPGAPLARLQYPPVFVVGHPRSGTTWLARLLGAHPRIASGGETHLFNYYLERLLVDHERWLHDWVDDDALHALVRDFVTGVFQAAIDTKSKVRVVEKTPTHRLWVKEIRRLFPDARFIRCVRDGRDVALSMQERRRQPGADWIPATLPACARRWRDEVERLRDLRRALGEEVIKQVRFEDLVRRPNEELAALFSFLGEATTHTQLTRILDQHPPRADRTEVWRDHLSPAQKRRIRDEVGGTLSELGYPLR